MSTVTIDVTEQFKKQSKKAINAIGLFVFSYVVILLLAIALTVSCVLAGIGVIVAFPRFITLALGVGIASLGVFVLIFLIKFLFKKNKVDYSHLQEIHEKDHPAVFKMINELVEEIGTLHPKKVYLSPDVNASVFYDSSFLSMFLPIKKNLLIGVGLVNCIHVDELRSILAHEFGHFSQKSMKVGSYVYHVNQIIHNMLFDNESYDRMVERWAQSSGYFAIFLIIAVKIVAGIQWLLGKLYTIVNKAYLGLSREMEFHADEIAVNVTGYAPLKSSLLRMNLADYAFNSVVSFYEKKIPNNIKSINVFKEQFHVMSFYSELDNLEIDHQLPVVTLYEQNKFNKSKLVIKDQWASHPSTEDRITEMKAKAKAQLDPDKRLAKTLFNNFESIEASLTAFMFKNVEYAETPTTLDLETFKSQFKSTFSENTFSKIFNSYYDNYNTQDLEINSLTASKTDLEFNELFSDANVDKCYEALALESDIEALKLVAEKTSDIKSFDYDGKRFYKKDALRLVKQLEKELVVIKEFLKSNDSLIYQYFKNLEEKSTNKAHLVEHYQKCFDFSNEYDKKLEVVTDLYGKLEFVSQTTPFNKIQANFLECEPLENKIKAEIKEILDNPIYEAELTEDIKKNFKSYISKKWFYFGDEKYFDDNLGILFSAISDYTMLTNFGYFKYKKQLLNYKESLLN